MKALSGKRFFSLLESRGLRLRRIRGGHGLALALVGVGAASLSAGQEPLPTSRSLHAWATATGGEAAAEFAGTDRWAALCGRDALTGASTGCVLHSPPHLEVGGDGPGGLGDVGVDCRGRVFARAASGAMPTRYVVPSRTGDGYGWIPRPGSAGDRLLRELDGGGEEAAVREALRRFGYLFTSEDTVWAGEVFAFEVEGGAVFRMPFGEADRVHVDAFLAGEHCAEAGR